MLTRQAEELLSYMIGLAPVGQPIFMDPTILSEDMGISNKQRRSQLYNQLISNGCIRREAINVFTVLRRDVLDNNEAELVRASAPHTTIGHYCERPSIVRDWERQARLIPRDTRDLTARMFGDPLPARSALAQRENA